MKIIEKYVDEISGKEFSRESDAIKSEKKNGGIKKLFSFWKYPPKDGTCKFANGGWCYQRTDVEFIRLVDSLIKAVKDYEPWIAKQYEKNGGLQREHIGSGYMIGRYLDDGHSELYSWYGLISNICPKCFREWGQPYYANNCSHLEKPREVGA
ncbi:hypothetical protein KKH13_05070 [Patescibacteria group bacterium]|nr:hypothetical protein [Patescibacteria group bacterium]